MPDTVIGGDQQDAWYSGLDDDSKGWVTQRGLDKFDANAVLPELVKGYRGAESKLGVPADQLLRLPKEDDNEGFMQLMSKLGRPEKPEDYGLPIPEGDQGEFAKVASGWFHKHGVPKKLAHAIAGEWNAYQQSVVQAHEAEAQKAAEADLQALKAEWKDGFDQNVELARRVRRAAGVSDEEAVAIEKAIGVKRAAMVFAELGKGLGEARFIEGNAPQLSMSPEAARAKIAQLRGDQAYMAAYTAGDAAKIEEMTRLHRIGFPDQ